MGKKQANKDQIENSEPVKKPKLFSAKIFRKEISTPNVFTALQNFLDAIKDSESHDYILEYLENGGSCLELLQVLEQNSAIPPSAVFEIITHILLRISSSYPQYQSSAYESCRYLLNNYITVINKMINMSSTTPERKSCLKLLTAMVAFSPILAKDILMHVNFHSSNVELLTKHTGETDSVRDNFIQFLTAYLVDGHYPALSVLLEKKGFFTSIITGLKFDSADTLCLVVSAMKNFILENPSVSKTAKMKTFNTVVIRDIVNLYNWKGPAGFRALKKNKSSVVTVNEVEKSKVSEAVHDFLLVLCTSHKYGIIFKDHLVGLGKKNQNALMYTVLESLDRPWEHSYASEFVTKICGASPDLSKTLWSNLKSFLEPRMSPKWVSAMKFAITLVKQLQPSCIEYCIRELSEIQLFQIVQCLVLPLPILKTIIPENVNYDSPSVKQYIYSLLLEMLKAVKQYVTLTKTFLNPDKQAKFELMLNKHVSKNFPDAIKILTDWDQLDENSHFTNLQNLAIIVDILNHYKMISPELLDNISNNDAELCNLLYHEESDEFNEPLANLQVKIVSLFVDLDQSKFTAQSKMFSSVVPLMFKIYYNNPSQHTLDVLNKLFRNTGIFDGCLYEINIWINGILDLKNFDGALALNIIDILKITNENILKFLEELSTIQSEASRGRHFSEIIQNLMIQTDFSKEIQKYPIKHRYLSPMVLGLVTFLSKNYHSKALKVYINFVFTNLLHLQTNIQPIVVYINKIDLLPSHFKDYAAAWIDCKEIVSLQKSKGRISIFKELSEQFLSGNIDNLKTTDLNTFLELKLNLLDMIIFYITNLLNNDSLTTDIVERSDKLIKTIITKEVSNPAIIERILCHPILVYNTKFLDMNKQKSHSDSTKLIISITKYLLDLKLNIDIYLNVYREKLLHSVLKILNKPQNYTDISLDLKTLLQMYHLGYNECFTILTAISQSFEKYCKHDLIIDILYYSLNELTDNCKKDSNLESLEKDIIQKLTSYYVLLAENEAQFLNILSPVFLEYFKVFPHNLAYIDKHLFKSIIELDEINKENVKLATFLLQNDPIYLKFVGKKIDVICEKKGLLLPLLQVLCKIGDEELLKQIYDLIEASLNKVLQKPQKAGQSFQQNYQGLIKLLDKAMPVESCKTFCDKVQKFDTTEIFHVNLLKTVYLKCIDESITSKEINNILMTLVHVQINLFKKGLKSDSDISKATEIVPQFVQILKKLKTLPVNEDMQNTAKNESLKLYFKFCLKFGVSQQPIFLEALRYLLEILGNNLEKEDGRLILDMLTSHSEFLETVLKEHSETKIEILSLYLVLCKAWPDFMERNFVPLLLASYRGQVNKCDRIILVLLKMFESKPEQTHFYDFKPFLWGKAAATHYSVKHQIERALLRQPKMSDVLDLLQEDLVTSTITNYPLKDNLRSEESDLLNVDDQKSYDLVFMLPLFSQLLAPEQQVQTYKFTRSGALSLTVIGLSSTDKEIRQAACHVLARFHYHVDARQTGKDNLLWIRYVEAVCKGTALLPDFKLNNFAAIYLARMALILTQPNHVMYLPLSQHLTAKSSLDFSTVPELYTFLHSCDVNYKEHRNFTLELLRDGLRTDKDFSDFMRSMAFKLFSELYCSSVSDLDTKLLILDVVKSICDIPLGVKVLCENTSFLTQACTDVLNILRGNSKDGLLVTKILDVLLKIVKQIKDRHANFMVFEIVKNLLYSELYFSLVGASERIFFEVIFIIQSKFFDMFCEKFYDSLLEKTNDSVCKYWTKYGCDYVNVEELDKDDKYYYVRLVFINFIRKKGKKQIE